MSVFLPKEVLEKLYFKNAERLLVGLKSAREQNGPTIGLRDQFLDDVPVNIGQSKVSPRIAVGEPFVIEAE